MIEIHHLDPGRPFRALIHAGASFPRYWHRHPHYELLCVTRGDGDRQIGNHLIRAAAPQALLLGPMLPHAVAAEGPYEHMVLLFAHACLGAGFWSSPGCEAMASLLERSRQGLLLEGPAALQVAAEMRRLMPLTGARAIAALLDSLALFSELAPQPILTAAGREPCEAPQHQRILAWIGEQYQRDLTLADGAAVLGMHPKAFARFFRRATGHSFLGYLGHVRIDRACDLLRDSDRRITDIALDVGFGTQASFNRLFLYQRGMTPSAYRQAIRSGTLPG